MGEDYALLSGRVIGESNMAMAYRAMGNVKEALDHSERAVKLLESCGQTEVQEEEIFFNHYLVLQDNKKPDEANDYLKGALDKMMSKAGNIKDSVTREIFLKRVSINGSINSAWKEQTPVNPSGTA